MTSQTSLDESLFGEFGLSHSLNFTGVKTSQGNDIIRKKRHKSAGDPMRRRALSLQEELKMRHISGEAGIAVVDMRRPKSDSEPVAPISVKEIVVNGEVNSKECDDTSQPLVNGEQSGEQSLLNESLDADRTADGEADISGIEPLPSSSELDLDQLESQTFSGQSSEVKDKEDVVLSQDLLSLKAALSPLDISTSTDTFDLKTDSSEMTKESSESTSGTPKLLSPTHSIRTPVTENDPLGLFYTPTHTASISDTTASSGVDLLCMTPEKKLVGKDSLLDMSEDSGVSGTTTRSANRTNLLIDIEPFSNTSTPVKQKSSSSSIVDGDSSHTSPVILAGTDGGGDGPSVKPQNTKVNGNKGVDSFSSSEASSPGSPAEAWAPISQSQVQSPVSTPAQKPAIQPAKTDPSGTRMAAKRGKPVTRGESFRSALTSMAGFASKAFSSKMNDFKQSMTAPLPPGSTMEKTSQHGSTTSLPKAHEMEKLLYEEEEDALRKAGNTETSVRSDKENLSRGSSVENFAEPDGKTRPASRYAPFSKYLGMPANVLTLLTCGLVHTHGFYQFTKKITNRSLLLNVICMAVTVRSDVM